MPSSLAATLGFVDEEYALLALEEDVMDDELQDYYRGSGVPALSPEDIKADYSESDSIPLNQWIDEHNPGIENMVATAVDHTRTTLAKGISFFVRNGILIIELDPEILLDTRNLLVAIYDISGKLVKRWHSTELTGVKKITWCPADNNLNSGIFFLRIKSDVVHINQRMFFR
ncbi:MAG: T9SS type A sorting domain-containing protein [Fibrobacteria bacterium]|nr:T9SS type A sorting domain-containing protein [Fibrobacteria bacterium]